MRCKQPKATFIYEIGKVLCFICNKEVRAELIKGYEKNCFLTLRKTCLGVLEQI
jgi:hypothetical protein